MVKIEQLLITNDDDARKAREFYGKTDTDMKRDIQILKEWLKQQPHLPDDEDDARLERLLIGNKCRVEVTKKKLEECYTFRTMYPDIKKYYDVKSDVFQEALKHFIMMPLPKLTDKLERIIYYKPLSKPDFKAEYNFCLILFIELLKVYDNSLAYIYLVDYQDATFDLIKKMDLPFVQKIVQISVHSLSGRFSHIFIYKPPSYIDILMKVMKLVLKPKLMDRLVICPDTEKIVTDLPKKFLPIEYGGENGSIDKLYGEWCNLLKENEKFFNDLSNKRSNESLRVGPIKANELFGTDGSFKKLNLD